MKILHQLERPNFKPSKSDKILVKYVKEHASEFCTTPIAMIASSCGVSEATITRFVRKMGFDSLQLFKLTLTEEMADSKKRSILSEDISCDESVMVTANKLLANNIEILERTVGNLNEEIIDKCVELLKNAERVFFIGLGNSGFIAQESAYKFLRIGINAKGMDNSHIIMLNMALLHQDNVVVAITHSGKSFEIVEALNLAKKNGGKIIVITSNKNAELIKYADVCIFYESGESLLETGAIPTKLTQIFIIDLIYTQVVKQTMNLAAAFRQRTAEAINFFRMKRVDKSQDGL